MDFYRVFDLTLLFAVVLGLGALSGYFSERVGIINLGINGMMIFGAIFYCIYGGLMNGGNAGYKGGNLGEWSFFIPMILSSLSTILVGFLFGLATIKLNANHIIAGTAINLLGSSFGIFLTNPLGSTILGTDELRNSYKPFLQIQGTSIFGSSIIIFILVAILVATIWVFVKYSKYGLRFRSIGENPFAADSQGIDVIKYQWIGIIISSAVAGLAGSVFMYQGTAFTGDVDSLGFLSLAIMIAGMWRIKTIAIVSIIFALLVSVSKQTFPEANISSDLLLIIPYALSLLSLIIFSYFKIGQAPKNLGKPFILEKVS